MADETWVVNASPIITLAKIGRLDLFGASERTLVLPRAVTNEILAGPSTDAGRQALESGFGGEPVSVEVTPAVEQWSLGRGESAVLTLARQRNATAIIDDRDARRAASSLGVSLLGTLGVVLRARSEKRISEAAPILKELRRVGLRLDDALIAAALDRAFGEIWNP